MAAKRKLIDEHDLQGFKYFKKLSSLVEHLHDAGCARDRASNRKLHMDQYMVLLLLYMFNPICDSLRSLQRASELRKVQSKLRVPRAALGSLSEAAHVFDSSLLIDLIAELAEEVRPQPSDSRLSDLGQIVTVVDGTLLKALPRTAQALWFDERHKGAKAHVQYELLKGVPTRCTLTDSKGNEKVELEKTLEPDRLYVLDRGYAKYALMQEIMDSQSSFVCRIADMAHVRSVVEEREITPEAVGAGIRRDAVVMLGSRASTGPKLHEPVRIIQLDCTEFTAKSRRAIREGRNSGETMLVATDRLDLPAEMISVLYSYRWQIEVFFRFFKHVLGCRHLLSHCENGIALQVYATIIACLVLALYTGQKPTKATTEMLGWYLMGWAEEDELIAHIARSKKRS
jgi:hypothetical protein